MRAMVLEEAVRERTAEPREIIADLKHKSESFSASLEPDETRAAN